MSMNDDQNDVRHPSSREKVDSLHRFRQAADPAAIDNIIGFVSDTDPWVRSNAIYAIGRVCGENATAIISECLENETAHSVKTTCIVTLGFIRSSASFNALISALHSSSSDIVSTAISSLCVQGYRESIAHMLPFLNHNDWSVRLHTCSAFVRFGVVDDNVIKALELLIAQPESIEHDDAILSERFTDYGHPADLNIDESHENFEETIGELLVRARTMVY